MFALLHLTCSISEVRVPPPPPRRPCPRGRAHLSIENGQPLAKPPPPTPPAGVQQTGTSPPASARPARRERWILHGDGWWMLEVEVGGQWLPSWSQDATNGFWTMVPGLS